MHSQHAASMIFTPVKPLPEILGEPRLRDDVLKQIYADAETQAAYERLAIHEQEALLEFCIGNRSLKITYDPFFNNIFHPLQHPGRLDRLLSNILKQPVTVKEILPREGMRLAADASFVIMDLLVELEDESLVNVEMQKIGYHFPIERTFCYGADLLVRQYDRTRDALGKKFTYRDMRPVYIIVLMEKSPAEFQKYRDTYLHHSTFHLDSGLSIGNLMNFIYIPLDIFLKMPHNELTELEAWLYFLGSDSPKHIQRITEKYPFFQELYRDIIDFQYHPKELIRMYSETLMIADRNTIDLMIDELRQAVAEKDAELLKRIAVISEKDIVISEKDAEIQRLKALLAERKS